MAYVLRVKNDTLTAQTWAGKAYAAGEEHTLSESEYSKYRDNDSFLTAVTAAEALIGDASSYYGSSSDAIDHLKALKSQEVEVVKQDSAPPFANKTLSDGKKLYRRKHGITLDNAVTEIAAGETKTLSLVVPYNNAKIDKLEIIGGKVGDSIDLKVYDTPTGTITSSLAATGYTAIPNFMLNQFGFGVYVCGPFYEDHSNYDADLIKDMKIELVYTNNHATDAIVPYGNIVLHEVK